MEWSRTGFSCFGCRRCCLSAASVRAFRFRPFSGALGGTEPKSAESPSPKHPQHNPHLAGYNLQRSPGKRSRHDVSGKRADSAPFRFVFRRLPTRPSAALWAALEAERRLQKPARVIVPSAPGSSASVRAGTAHTKLLHNSVYFLRKREKRALRLDRHKNLRRERENMIKEMVREGGADEGTEQGTPT